MPPAAVLETSTPRWSGSAGRPGPTALATPEVPIKDPDNEIFDVVRRFDNAKTAFDALRNIGKSHANSPIWSAIQTPNIEADIEATTAWLRGSLTASQPTGIYLGLDTLNEDEGTGKNLEIGWTSLANHEETTMDWAWHCEHYGEDILIRGMYEVHSTYDDLELEFPVRSLADYLFFFGYSGVVLASALERLPVNWNSLFVWGFHDGDLAYLARCSHRDITRLAIR